jgi:hypothetical protein
VTIIGTNFANVISVNFGTVSAIQYTVNSATMITAVAPTQPVGSYPVTVTTSAGTSPVNPNAYFTYTGTTPAGPVITNISPNSTPVNTTPTVTITGTGFSGATTVSFGGQVATIVGTPTATQIVVVAPSRVTPGTVRVVVTTPFGTSPDNASDSFTYGSPPPTGNVKTITLYARWSLITYQGPTREALAALKGVESPDDPRTNDVSGRVTAIFYWSANGAGCAVGESQCWLAWFPTGVGVPGANDFDNLVEDRIYWIAINGTGSVNWIYPEG